MDYAWIAEEIFLKCIDKCKKCIVQIMYLFISGIKSLLREKHYNSLILLIKKCGCTWNPEQHISALTPKNKDNGERHKQQYKPLPYTKCKCLRTNNGVTNRVILYWGLERNPFSLEWLMNYFAPIFDTNEFERNGFGHRRCIAFCWIQCMAFAPQVKFFYVTKCSVIANDEYKNRI